MTTKLPQIKREDVKFWKTVEEEHKLKKIEEAVELWDRKLEEYQ